MLRSYGLGFLFLALIGVVSPSWAGSKKFVIDVDHATIGFMVTHIGYAKTFGRFAEFSGEFLYDVESQTLSNLKVVVQTASVQTWHDKRDGHVNNQDFLNVDHFPTMTFVLTRTEKLTDTTGRIYGDLTLLGVTKEIALDMTLNKIAPYPFGHKKNVIGVSGRGSLKRSEWGMSYGVAGDIVSDEVGIVLEIEAIEQE